VLLASDPNHAGNGLDERSVIGELVVNDGRFGSKRRSSRLYGDMVGGISCWRQAREPSTPQQTNIKSHQILLLGPTTMIGAPFRRGTTPKPCNLQHWILNYLTPVHCLASMSPRYPAQPLSLNQPLCCNNCRCASSRNINALAFASEVEPKMPRRPRHTPLSLLLLLHREYVADIAERQTNVT
jgi:hypothetical protein